MAEHSIPFDDLLAVAKLIRAEHFQRATQDYDAEADAQEITRATEVAMTAAKALYAAGWRKVAV